MKLHEFDMLSSEKTKFEDYKKFLSPGVILKLKNIFQDENEIVSFLEYLEYDCSVKPEKLSKEVKGILDNYKISTFKPTSFLSKIKNRHPSFEQDVLFFIHQTVEQMEAILYVLERNNSQKKIGQE
ncbi:hypothetical protein DLH72_02155 [Candidatus Gracilibacteria bacterium]|nr:MAG: hypothetical protein DLH72_02155 [Candidatus Gracilibacteria bacterium]